MLIVERKAKKNKKGFSYFLIHFLYFDFFLDKKDSF